MNSHCQVIDLMRALIDSVAGLGVGRCKMNRLVWNEFVLVNY